MSLEPIKKENIGKKIKKEFNYTFKTEQGGIYVILVTAKAKSWFQNLIKFISFFADDNLILKINGAGFPKLSGESGEFDGEASWNGNKLRGLRQVNLFVVYLKQGGQELDFVSKGAPFLESIEIYQVSKNKVSIDPSKYGIEDGDKRPWFNLLTQKVGIVSVFAKTAVANLDSGDDDDLQIRINGAREKNDMSKAHKYWFWCGRVLGGQSKIFEKTLNLKPDVNYIEFWADKTPLFNEFDAHVTMSERIPSVDDPLWTGDFYDDSEEMSLARLIFGEARSQSEEAKIWVASTVINRRNAPLRWPDTIHDVILDPGQYDSFKPSDEKNYPRVINPLGLPNEVSAWKECYRIAEEIVGGSLNISTETTHFHDSRQSQESFLRDIIPTGKFLKKIDDLYFYWSPN